MSIVLEGKIRETRGKGGARQVRREAGLPAVIYGLDGNLSLQVPSKKFHKLIKDKGKNILIDLEIEGDSKKQRKVMVKEYQTHPLEDDWLHVDFLELDMNKKNHSACSRHTHRSFSRRETRWTSQSCGP